MTKAIEQQMQDALRKMAQLEDRVKALESLNAEYRKTLKEHNVYLVHLRKANRKASRTNS